MLLLIPAIEIKNGKCVHTVTRSNGTILSDDPLEMVKLWRVENAKSLHITDIDGALAGHPVNLDVIGAIVKSIDIPIALSGGLRTFDDVQRAFDCGVFRATIGTMLIEDPDSARNVLEHFSASYISIGIDAENGIAKIKGQTVGSGLTAVSVALNAKQLGFRRVVYKDIVKEGGRREPNFTAIRTLAEAVGMKVTASGGISDLNDLLKLQELEHFGVDSVIVGRALYQDKFSCQAIWRTNEEGNYPYTAKV
jgi:phosphoribosylformimino-5-aminoimidazole carboxamide ribotide isomerase